MTDSLSGDTKRSDAPKASYTRDAMSRAPPDSYAQRGGESAYTFQSQPRALRNGRKKYREQGGDGAKPVNIMFDSRVIRGNTYAAVVPTRTQRVQESSMQTTIKRKASKRRGGRAQRPTTPEPVAGRKNTEVQTDNFLEELVDRPFEEDMGTQTDALADHPSAPIFVPKPSGESKGTEIKPGELFDFDIEVEPILEVLVGKSTDQALMEVLEEEELKELSTHKKNFEQKRNTMLAEVQRIESAEKRRVEEKDRRVAQAREFEQKQKQVAEKAKARTAAKKMLANVEASVFERLHGTGDFKEPVLAQVTDDFLPWLLANVNDRVETAVSGRSAVDQLVQDAMKQLSEDAAKQEELDRLAEEAEKKRQAEERARKEREEAEAKAKAEAEAKAKEEEESG